MRKLFILTCLLTAQWSIAQYSSASQAIQGNWVGIDMYQDENSYDGQNFFLPNEEFIIVDKDRIRIYFYPYSKSDEFDVKIDDKKISYNLRNNKVVTEYSFTNNNCDTLIFTMHFINKSFVKMYSRVTSINERMEIDYATIKELDKYGFNPSAVHHLFEVDTFHTDLYQGFSHIDCLDFKPFQHLQFLNDEEISIDRGSSVGMKRAFKVLSFEHQGKQETIEIQHSEGTQSLSIIPKSQCRCDSIIIPYLTVDWADRIRKDMRENPYKYD